MVPYIDPQGFSLFGLPVQPFGLLVVTGVLVGNWFAHKRARQVGIPEEEISNAIFWAVSVGFIMSHVVEVVFYQPHRLEQDGLVTLLYFWDGMSSYGGFLGGFIGLFIYYKIILKKPWLDQIEVILQAFVIGWIFGRAGCSVAHDHIGVQSDFFLAVNFPDGPRHDLGFYEFLYTVFVMVPAVLWAHAKQVPRGSYVGIVCLLYGPVRFVLDFLRIPEGEDGDIRYGGLTIAQYGSILLFLVGLYMLIKIWSAHRAKPA